MKKTGDGYALSATDLVGFLNCQYLTDLDRAVADGVRPKPASWSPALEALWERGAIHEDQFVAHLREQDHDVVVIDGVDVSPTAIDQTIAAMRAGSSIIVQGALTHEGWGGRIDVLRRVETPSALGPWSYEVTDTKLARETKAGTVLQLCLYSDLVAQVQKVDPEHMDVVSPWTDFKPQRYRYHDYAAFYRKAKSALAGCVRTAGSTTYPEPKAHCEVCRWAPACDKRRREDDHLCLVAGISKIEINELRRRGIATTSGLAQMPLPLGWKPERGAPESYVRIREQARIQVEGRLSGEHKFELLPVEEGFGLARLPVPSSGDIFFDIEGDSYVGEGGLEYLFGFAFQDGSGRLAYRSEWAFSREEEKRAFETFIDFVMDRWAKHPGLHITRGRGGPAAAREGLRRSLRGGAQGRAGERGKLFVEAP
ncbi:MAG: TM0106 family RecB-like putative nuclease [Hyphomicrobiaceae bacterium]